MITYKIIPSFARVIYNDELVAYWIDGEVDYSIDHGHPIEVRLNMMKSRHGSDTLKLIRNECWVEVAITDPYGFMKANNGAGFKLTQK